VGKSGFVAQKIATTMMSTGTKALYIPPIDALHGDIGMVSNRDILVVLSKSGETEELLQLLPSIRNKGAKIFAITSNPTSRLARASDRFIDLPCVSELCPFDLAPTISTEIQLLFGDVIAMHLMQVRGFSLQEYADNHPAGRIGKRATLRVKDLMLDAGKTPLCYPSDTLEKVLVDFSDKRCGCLVVIDKEKRLQGIFTDGDLRRALQRQGEQVLQQRLEKLMTSKPKAIGSEMLAWEALKLMEADQKHPVMVLPVVEGTQVIGLIKMHDIIQAGL
jgi:arabinose-5-phosphate isomerase